MTDNFRLRILVVEDDEDLRTQLASTLRRIGADVITAADGAEAWQQVQTHAMELDLVVTDVRMPQMDGIELLERIQLHYAVPVAIITGHGDLNLAVSALRKGAADFLPKPVGRRELEELIDRIRRLHAESGSIVASVQNGVDETLLVRMRSEIGLVPQVVRRSSHWYGPVCQLYRQPSRGIDLALTEAVMNAIVHGNLEIESRPLLDAGWDRFQDAIHARESDPQYGGRLVSIEVSTRAGELRIDVTDQGRGFDSSSVPDLDDDSALELSGRGLVLIRASMDEVCWNEVGNKISMRKALGSAN